MLASYIRSYVSTMSYFSCITDYLISHFLVVPIVTPSRVFTTPTPTISVVPTTTPSLYPTVTPAVSESDELSTAAVIGIVVGSVTLLFVVVLILCVVANR